MVPRVGSCLWTGPRAVPLCLPAQSQVTDLPALPGPSRTGLATPGVLCGSREFVFAG